MARGSPSRLVPMLCTAVLAVQALLVSVQPVRARQAVTERDSLIEQARLAGREMANRRQTWPYFLAPLPGVAVLGFMVPIALGESEDWGLDDPESQFVLGGAAAVGAAFAVAAWMPAGPTREDERLLEGRTPEWQAAFREAYEDRHRSRRVRSALWGSLAGAAAGLGLLLAVGVALAG